LITRSKIVLAAIYLIWIFGCAGPFPRHTNESSVRLNEHAKVGQAMITITNIAFREGKGRSCLFIGGSHYKEITSSAFQDSLVYEGMSGNTIKMSHSEFMGDLNKAAFVNPLEHDLKESSIFWFLDRRIRILEATREYIRFEDLGTPMGFVNNRSWQRIVNINARINKRSQPVRLFFAGGTYEVIPIGVADGGEYKAWTPHEGDPNWVHRYCIESDEFHISEERTGEFETDLAALENATNKLFAITEEQFVAFYIEDRVHTDNTGGVSLLVRRLAEPNIVITKLAPSEGIYGTKIRIMGEGFGDEQSDITNGAEGYQNVVSFSMDEGAKKAIATQYTFWSDGEVEVILDDLFFDGNGNYLKNSGEPFLTVDQMPLDEYNVAVETIWFHDENDNNIYDAGYERHNSFSSKSKVFNLTGTPPVVSAGPDVSIEGGDQGMTVIRGTAMDLDGNTLRYRWLEGEDELSAWKVLEWDGECQLALWMVPECSPGDHALTLEVTDGFFTESDEMIFTVEGNLHDDGIGSVQLPVKERRSVYDLGGIL
jgi:hypothetical protein